MTAPTPTWNRAILAAARGYLGLEEWPGARHNPEILRLWELAGMGWVEDDETPWCAAFANAVVAQVGLTGTGKANARSFGQWGAEVPLWSAQPGDIAVLWRGSPDGWQGHVGIVERVDGQLIYLVGGNQGNAVTVQGYAAQRLLSIRRATGNAARDGRPVLTAGERGGFVTDLQMQLRDLGYFAGRIDGDFGPRTRAAVLAFQADNGLTVDGVVGPQTWDALKVAPPRADRDVTLDDLRAEGDEAVGLADKAEGGLAAMMGGGGLAGTAIGFFTEHGSAIERATAFARENWPVIVVAGVFFVGALWVTGKLKGERVAAARKGRLIG